MIIHNIKVNGTDVDNQTRCSHYRSDLDIIAIKFKCCEEWFSCYECHAEQAMHAPEVWAVGEYDKCAVLCGNCGQQLTIAAYLKSESICPQCRRRFNPKCALHYHLYFEKYGADDSTASQPAGEQKPFSRV